MTGVSPPDPRNIIGHVPGRLIVSPTDLTAAFPYGGTSLGEVQDAELIREAPVQILTAEEHGNEPYDGIAGGEAWSLAAALRSYNVEAYGQFFLNAGAGETSQRAGFETPGENRAGYQFSKRNAVFCFAPYSEDIHPFVVFYAGMPMVEDTAELATRLGGESDRFLVPVVIVATRDTSDRVMACRPRKDITL